MRNRPTAVVLQCTNKKREEEAAACDLYDPSTYFRKQRAYARATGAHWYIQSAKHGLVHPDVLVKPYDQRAEGISEPDRWAENIAESLAGNHEGGVIEVLGGGAYADPLTPALEKRGFDVLEPLRGLGIGERMAKLDQMREEVSHAPLHG
jgi:hypothetical protein